MNNLKFIPELHDIGKLVDERVKEEVKNEIGSAWKSHVFIGFNFQKVGIPQPASPSRWSQYHHEIKNRDINDWSEIPSDFRLNMFLLILADHLASSVSRATLELERGATQEGIIKLWNKQFYNSQERKGKHWAAFRTKEDLKKLFDKWLESWSETDKNKRGKTLIEEIIITAIQNINVLGGQKVEEQEK